MFRVTLKFSYTMSANENNFFKEVICYNTLMKCNNILSIVKSKIRFLKNEIKCFNFFFIYVLFMGK